MAGQYLHHTSTPINHILASPLKRAQETAQLIQSQISGAQIETTEYLVNGTDHRQLLNQLDTSKAASVLLVGHIPYLEHMITILVGKERTTNVEMRKCSLACVDIEQPLVSGSGKLEYLHHFKDIESQLQSLQGNAYGTKNR